MATHLRFELRQNTAPSSSRHEPAASLTPAPRQLNLGGPDSEEVQRALSTVLRFVQQQDEACLSDEDDAITIQHLIWKVQTHSA